MQINYTANAFASLASLINFIEEKNTAGAGIRWLQNYESFWEKPFPLLLVLSPATFSLCMVFFTCTLLIVKFFSLL